MQHLELVLVLVLVLVQVLAQEQASGCRRGHLVSCYR